MEVGCLIFQLLLILISSRATKKANPPRNGASNLNNSEQKIFPGGRRNQSRPTPATYSSMPVLLWMLHSSSPPCFKELYKSQLEIGREMAGARVPSN